MAVTNGTHGSALTALTLSALALPGLLPQASLAVEPDGVDFQYSRYRESKRDIEMGGGFGVVAALPQSLRPIEVDGLDFGARVTLNEHLRLKVNFQQDTWSGATPIGSAPVAANGGNGPRFDAQGIVVGASPYAALPMYGDAVVDRDGNFYDAQGQRNNRHTDVLSSASPETRQQGAMTLGYEFGNAALEIGGGLSSERDYESRFINLGGRFDFNLKRTTLSWGLAYTNSETAAKLDADALPFISTDAYDSGQCLGDGSVFREFPITPSAYVRPTCGPDGFGGFGRIGATLHGQRHDKSGQLSLTQVLSKHDVLTVGLGYTHSTGYMANPYKVVFGHAVVFGKNEPRGHTNLYGDTGSSALLEVRPRLRMLFDWHAGYQHYVAAADAALHLDYRFAHDDWGIQAHTIEGQWVQALPQGWTVTPRLRYYSQSRADFYTLAVFEMVEHHFDSNGNFIDSQKLRNFPRHYSSDHRLSGFGTLGPGVTVSKDLVKGLRLEAGFDYYLHEGGLKLGSGGQDSFADYHYWMANAALSVDLDRLTSFDGDHGAAAGHGHHHTVVDTTPAGVMFDHSLAKAGEVMIGYRFMRSSQGGGLLRGSSAASLAQVRESGCEGQICAVTPRAMSMNMHMLDLMFAVTDRLSLMLMPQWMDMNMSMTPNPAVQLSSAHGAHSSTHRHETGGVGDTGVYALYRLFERHGQRVNLALGGTVPTGDVDVRLRKDAITPVTDQRIHYGMQLGSGTWDLQPSLTYSGETDIYQWGAQMTGTLRLERRNTSKYALGDIFQSSVWGGLRVTPWLAANVRGVYTAQGKIEGRMAAVHGIDPLTGLPFVAQHVGPFDFSRNYGGEYLDVGLGLNFAAPAGSWQRNQLAVEWLLPAWQNVHGFQQERNPSVNLRWSLHF